MRFFIWSLLHGGLVGLVQVHDWPRSQNIVGQEVMLASHIADDLFFCQILLIILERESLTSCCAAVRAERWACF
ncbi:uncharacterized protein IWZ02DRAFT_290 [Phyllosticta citriasiana]|uniref:Secreted protein n=1 Tax=Phyllosticta citriasiana TaxID=595635 RepID=A0ABR1KHY6_9PEZI